MPQTELAIRQKKRMSDMEDMEDMVAESSRELLPNRREPCLVHSSPSPWFKYKDLAAFWLLGLLNNSSYVIMIAGKSLFQVS